MASMKVLPCSKRFVHDWTECPFAHPQEKARRRDPSIHNYTGIACPSMKKEGCCAFGDHCPYAHNVFEYWLHPTRYRTQLCNDGSNCKRKICFFAHSLDELRVPACKPFVSPEALASAAAAAAADAEAKRRAATIGSPLSAFATLSPGPSPQRASLGSLPPARLSGASVAAPASPSTTDDALMGSSPAEAGVQAALQQLAGAGFSSQEQQVIELVTSLLAQDKVSPEQAANILQQMLPPDTLSQLQAHLNTPRASMDEMRMCYSDPLAGRGAAAADLHMRASGSFDMSGASPRAATQAQQAQQAQQAAAARSAQQGLSLEHLAAMQAAQTMGFAGMSLQQGPMPAPHGTFAEYQATPRTSLESARSSFDTARMSFETSGRPSVDASRASVDAVYPPQLMPTLSGQNFYGAQLSPVPEQFPMINAPPPSSSWSMGAAGRFSLDSGTDRLSEDLSRLSFEAAARPVAAPTANPYASAFFMAGAPVGTTAPPPSEVHALELRMSAPTAGMGGMDRRLPPLPPLRTGSNKSSSPDPAEEPAGQLLGGTSLQRLQRVLPLLCLLAALSACAAGDGGAQTKAGQQPSPAAAATPPPPALAARKAAQLRAANSTAASGGNNGTAAAADARANKRQSLAWKHKRRPCAENDAKCIALRDHECDPYFVNVTDKCTFVQYNRACLADVHQIAYLPTFYCAKDDGRALVALGFSAWMAVLFWVMAVVAEDFLVPALGFVAHWLRMAPDVAGVTLFSLASGAPDLFTQIAAVAAGGHVNQELAISATLGGGLFIISVIFAVVALVRKSGTTADSSEPREITDRRAFVRDAVAYALSVLALLGLMLRGTFSAWEATLLLVGYGVYLAVCIVTSRAGGGGSGASGVGHRHAYFAVTPSQEHLQLAEQQALVGSPAGAAAAAAAAAGGLAEAGEAYGASTGVQLPRQFGGVVVAGGAALPGQQIELVSRAGGTTPQRKSAAQLAALESGSRPASPLPLRDKPLGELGGIGGGGQEELASLVAGAAPSDGGALALAGPSPRGAAALRSKLAAGHSSRMGKLVHSASLGLEELLHLHGKSGPRLWLSFAMAPAMLLLHATMPALHPGYYTPTYAVVVSFGAPLFALLGTELYPHRLSTGTFLLAWLLAALVLLVLMLLVVRPAGSSSTSQQQQLHGTQQQSGLNGSTVAVTAIASGSPLGAAPPPSSPQPGRGWALGSSSSSSGGSSGGRWARMRQRLGARRQRRNLVLALLAAVQCTVWMSLAADELVALFQAIGRICDAIGRICDISQDLLGATVLAWGEAVPELAATLSLARQGQGTMALAAVFGGPVFNVLVAWSAPTLYAALRHGPMSYQLSPGVGILVAFTLGVLCLQLAAFPLLSWRLDRRAAAAVLALFVLAQAFFLSKELF
ncbi:Zn-finger CCCH type isoform A [Chlorella sorokiniana]|uniref:Zn-finger CCCH type isoform A n=1 Tax=Chlorella sorokiniana TaxID=3076 RepID=A0A2P6TKA1_CHLSO|nr:Zn-finger CCCH type isoform A [Chlorella sorokiniana]|eukprot:PRW44495.1 Zn-finger CCCH type isoform A [Chlorella sorokiniana]